MRLALDKMANQTVSITPADTTDPTLLYRALSRITEAIDELKGYRGGQEDSTQEELNVLVERAKELTSALETLAAELDSKVNQETPKSLQDLADQVAALDTQVTVINNTKPILGFACCLTGAGSSNPTTSNLFNIASITRLSTGSYRVVLTNVNIAGRPVLSSAAFMADLRVAGSLYAKHTITVFNANTLDISVSVLGLNATPALTSSAYDLTTSDRLDVIALLPPL